MNSQRLIQLNQFLEEDPKDPFNWYALALEYLKTDHMKASELFTKILDDFPTYIPTYYQAGMLAMELRDDKRAHAIFEKGINQAVLQRDLKAANELRSALNELL